MSTELLTGATHGILAQALELHPQVTLRDEPFGALAYHYENRRLVFLKHRDVVEVARSLSRHASLAATLRAHQIPEHRWPSFITAFESLHASDVVQVRSAP